MTSIRNTDGQAIYVALQSLANRALTPPARMHIVGCLRAFKPHVEDYRTTREGTTQQFMQPMATGEEGQRIAFRDPLAMQKALAECDRMTFEIRLPRRIKADELPVNDKAHPNNEDGLAAIIADLGPMFEDVPIEYEEDAP